MRKRYFARLRNRTAAGYACGRYRVVRRAEGANADKRVIFIKNSGYGMNFRGFNRFLKGHFRQNCGKPLCKHAFAGSGRSYKQDIMPARGCNLKSLFGGELPFNIAEIHRVRKSGRVYFGNGHGG